MAHDPTAENIPFYRGIKFKMAALIGLFVIVLMGLDTLWTLQLQAKQAEAEAHEKATVLATQMRAAWDYVELVQESANRNDDGSIRTKNLVCVVAAKSIARLFMEESDYTIRFVNDNPRQVVGTPDDFEEEALIAFRADRTLEAKWSVVADAEGNRVFRYVEPLYVTKSCLECHGDPAGELDQFGFAKEGMQVGEVGGAMSIIEPMDIYTRGMTTAAVQQGVIAALMLALLSVGIYVLVTQLILKRVSTLRASAHGIAQGDFEHAPFAVPTAKADELDQLMGDFGSMAEQLEGLYSNLEQKVAERTEETEILNKALMAQKNELVKAYTQLSQETAYKSEFFAIMSHELRTPLTSIMAFARLLEEDGLDQKGADNVREIQQSAQLLLDIVNNFLIMSRAETNRNVLSPEPVDFVDLVGLVKSQLAPLAQEREIGLSARADADVPVSMADWEKLRRILENLTNNAIKYTHRGGSVEVHVSFEPEGLPPEEPDGAPRDAIVMSVKDDGIGIAEEDREVIFDYYQQAARQSANKRYRGSGLGLAVVRELTHLHGGTVELESKLKCGSTFTIRIPYVPVESEEFYE